MMATDGFAPYQRLFGTAAILGGVLRLGANFFPWRPGDPFLEALAAAIDLLLIFGFMGFYCKNASRLGTAGLTGFVISISGLAFITGPDGVFHGIDIYQTGVAIIGAGLVIFSLSLLVNATALPAATAWIGAAAAQTAGWALNAPQTGFFAAGILFAFGFVFVGLEQFRRGT